MKADRFSRQNKIKWFNQKKVNASKVAVIGCGALGTEVAKNLSFLGVGEILLIDMDSVEEHNLNRQFFNESQIGTSKSKSLAVNLQKINSKIRIVPFTSRVESLFKNFQFGDVEWYFDCLDNVLTRKLLNEFCVSKKKRLVHGGTSPDYSEIQVYVPGKTACLQCNPYPEESSPKKQSCADYEAAICTTNGVTANLMVDQFLNYLFNLPDRKSWITYGRNKGLIYKEVPKRVDCEVCGKK